MGQVIPFITRIGASSDWSAEERARLAELGERLIAAGLKVEVIYGATEEGDPWCVVKDESEEVLIHVARIGGAFVIHYALDDSLRRGDDLPTILSERLAWEDSPEGVTPFSRQAQSLLALIVATAFFYESARHEDGGPFPAAAHTGPAGEDAAHAIVQNAGADRLADDLAASKALHAEAMAQAAVSTLFAADVADSSPEWRSYAFQDNDIGRADHGGGELTPARLAPAGLAAVSNLDVATPTMAASPAIVAFGGRFAADRAAPLATPSSPSTSTPGGASTGAATPAPHTPFGAANFRTGDPDRQPPADHPVAAAYHWVDVDLDGDGRPDLRVQVPDDPKAPSKEPETTPAPTADHEAIVAVGHVFAHSVIA